MESVRLEDIVVGERRREDLGDIQGLAESIKRHGLIHPIVVDANKRLIAGGRRLLACALLGWEEVPVRYLGDLTERERQEIELEENLRRKDLTEYEKAKAMVAYVETVKDVAKEQAKQQETCPDSGQVSRPARGPSRAPGSVRDVEQRTGIPRQTISTAQTHVATVERFPFMQPWSQMAVLEGKKLLEKLPEPEHQRISYLMSQPGIPADKGFQMVKNLVQEKTPQQREVIYQLNESPKVYQRQEALTLAANMPPVPDPSLAYIRDAIKCLKKGIEVTKYGEKDVLRLICQQLDTWIQHTKENHDHCFNQDVQATNHS